MSLQSISLQLLQNMQFQAVSTSTGTLDAVSSNSQHFRSDEAGAVEAFNLQRLQVELHRLSQTHEHVADDEKVLLCDLLGAVRKHEASRREGLGHSEQHEGTAMSSSAQLEVSSEDDSQSFFVVERPDG